MADLNDFNKPTVADTRVDVQDTHRAHAIRAIKLDPGTASNRPTGSKLAELISNVFTLKNWNGAAYDTWLTISNFWRGVLSSADAPSARDLLGVPPLCKNYHSGFVFDATGPVNLTIIGGGQCADSTNSIMIDLTAGFLNKGVGVWVVGSGNGGLDTGSIAANTWYHWHIIRRADTGVVDLLFSTSYTAPTMPSGYTHRRWVGSFRTNASSQWIAFHQTFDDVFWLDPITDVATGSTAGVGFRSFPSLTVPLGFRCKAYIGVGATSSSGVGGLVLSDLQSADSAPLTSSAQGLNSITVSSGGFSVQRVEIFTSSSREIGARVSSGFVTYGITTFGFSIACAKGRS